MCFQHSEVILNDLKQFRNKPVCQDEYNGATGSTEQGTGEKP